MVAKNNSSEIRLVRTYEAPLAAVWEAWTDPEQVGQWWGPRGFTLTTHSKDLRPGGHWAYTMHGPDGVDYENKTVYHEVEPMKKLVYDHGGNDDRPPLFRVTVLFAEDGGKTRMDMSMKLKTPEEAAKTRQFIKEAGGNATWDRLGEYLTRQSSGKEQFRISRAFDAPRELMFEMWTDPEHFEKWLAPKGFSMQFKHADIRPGGSTLYSMSDGRGMTMWGRAEYLEIRKPDRIVYTQQFCDEAGKVSRHPMAPTWPATMLTTVSFDEEGPDQTRVTVEWEPFGDVTAEELATFVNERGGMTKGWTGSFDKLESLLAESMSTR